MAALHSLLSVLTLTVAAQPEMGVDVVVPDAPRRYVVVERPGEEPVAVKGSDVVLARNDLVGLWEVSYLEQRATSRPQTAAQLHLRFSRGKIELFQADRPPKVVAYRITTDDYPRRFDWYQYRGDCLKLQRGVYWEENETLLLCLGPVNGRRATDFVTTPYDGRTLFVLRRLQDAGEETPASSDAP